MINKVKKLREIIDEIDVLINGHTHRNDPLFTQWHSKTKRFLFNHYGEDSIEYHEFVKLQFTTQVSGYDGDEYIFSKQRQDALLAAKGILQDYLSEISDDNSSNADSNNSDRILERIFTRFKQVALQLSRRYDGRETIRITDEYDVQDLLHSLLMLYFDDVRPEEWTPSYAGSSVRADFLIPEIETIIEVKKTRESMNNKKLSEELIIDIKKYQTHPKCKKIFFFVYDPDCILRNPSAIKQDLEQIHPGLVRVFIET